MPMVDEVRNYVIDVDDAPKVEIKKFVSNSEKSQILMGVEKCAKKDKGKYKEVDLVLMSIPQPRPPFP